MSQKKTPPAKPAKTASVVSEAAVAPKSILEQRWVVWALVGLSVALFLFTVQNEFINWDDPDYVYENAYVQQFTLSDIWAMFSQPMVYNYHPLTMLSLGINWLISGKEAWSYHLINVILHAINVFLIYRFVYRLTSGKAVAAFVVALFFGIHPLHVESVAWVSERKDMLYTLFFVGGMLTYLDYLDTSKTKYYLYTFALFVLSVLSKPSAVVFPIALLLIDYYRHRSFSSKWFIEKIPYFAISLLFGIITIQIQKTAAIGEFGDYSIPQRLLFACYGFAMYIFKLFFPFNLSLLYPYPKLQNGALPTIYMFTPIAVAAIIALTVRSAKSTRSGVFSVLFYFISIALVLQFVSVGEAIMSERYTYLAYLGLLLPLGLAVQATYDNPKWASYRTLALGIVGFYTLLCLVLSYQRIQLWKNSDTIWSDVIKQYPKMSATPYNNRGHYYRQNGKLQPALSDLNTAIELHPKLHLAYVNRGNTYFSMGGRDSLALTDYNKAVELKDDYSKAYGNRGSAYFRLGKYDLAMDDYNKALELDSHFPDAYLNRAVTFAVLNQHDRAKSDFDSYMRYESDNAQAYNWRGISSRMLKQYDQALSDANRAIALNNRVPDYYLNRSFTYNEMGDKAKALADAQKAQAMGAQVAADYLNSLR